MKHYLVRIKGERRLISIFASSLEAAERRACKYFPRQQFTVGEIDNTFQRGTTEQELAKIK